MASHFASEQGRGGRSSSGRRRSGSVPQIQRGSDRTRGGRATAGSHSRADAAYYAAARRGGHGGHGGKRRGRRVGLVVGVVLAVFLVVVGTCGVLLFRSAQSVRAQASELMTEAGTLADALKSGDAEALDESVADVQERVSAINAEVHTPLWNLATLVPVVGQDIRSVQILGETGTELVNDALVPLAGSISGTGLSDLIQDGAVNVGLIEDLSASLSAAAPTIQESVDTIAGLPEAHIPQLRDVLERVQGPVRQAQGFVQQLQPIIELLPQMLGSDGSRNYLIIAQNNAELRSLGGLPGSWGVLTITDGVISLGDFGTVLHKSGLQVSSTAEERQAININFDTDAAQLNYLPDFPRVGELAREYWEQMGKGDVDGVIAVDPVFLQRLLALTGGFTASDGTEIDGTNAAKVILSDAYWRLDGDADATDAFFSSVAGEAFSQIVNNLGGVGFSDLFGVIGESGQDGRLLVWMLDEDEESLMDTLGLSGRVESDPSEPVLGVYINDDTYSKISWYASCYTEVGEGVRNSDGTVTYDVTTTLANTITADEAASAPVYVSGVHTSKRSVDDMLNHIFLMAPAGGSISNVSVSDGALSDDWGLTDDLSLYGHQLVRMSTHLYGGQSAKITYQVTVSAEASVPLAVRTTPLAQESLMKPPSEQ